MNKEQRSELLDKIAQIAGEHCKAFVFIGMMEDENGKECISTSWNGEESGGRSTALGLLRTTQVEMELDIQNEWQAYIDQQKEKEEGE